MLYESLEQSGILGMKWGFRHQRKKSGKLTSKSKNKRAAPKKTVKQMTDKEIQTAISRMQLEKQYKELTSAANKKEISRGKAFVTSVLESSGKNIATQAATYALGSALNKAIGSNVVNPKKGQKDK